MPRTSDDKIECGCSGTYYLSNKSKHFQTKKHINWEQGIPEKIKEIKVKETKVKETKPKIVKEIVKEVEEVKPVFSKIEPILQVLHEEESEYPCWLINHPNDIDLFLECLQKQKRKYGTAGTSTKKKYVNTLFYNDIRSYSDIIHILKQVYSNAKNSFRINFSLGIIIEECIKVKDEDEYEYEYHVKLPGELYYFQNATSEQIKPEFRNVYNKKTFKENVLEDIKEEEIIEWLNNLLEKSSSRPICIYALGVKIIGLEQPIGCNKLNLPDWIINSHFITSLDKIDNNLCFFACIALAEGKRRDRYLKRAKELFCGFYKTNYIKTDYPGINYDENRSLTSLNCEIFKYEKFDNRFAINIWRIFEDQSCIVLRKSLYNPEDPQNIQIGERIPIYLNLYNNHFSFITEPNKILHYRCPICDKIFKEQSWLEKHKTTCSTEIKYNYNKTINIYKKPLNKIDELCKWYYMDSSEYFIYDYIITYDLEAINRTKENGDIIQIPLSYSVISNVPGYNKVEFFHSENPKEVVDNLFNYFLKVQPIANDLMLKKMEPLLNKIKKIKHKKIITDYCSSIPVVGFNSGGYDINIMLDHGFIEKIKGSFIIKSGKRFKAIVTDKFLFLDMMMYCAGGTTLDKFVKCYNSNSKQQKFEFPYRWLDDYKKLTTLIIDIPMNAFDNDLKKITYTKEQYDSFQMECKELNLVTVENLLENYNNRDVEPFLTACLEYKKFYYNLEINNSGIKLDVFKDAFTLPGLAAKIMNRTTIPDELYKIRYPPRSLNRLNTLKINMNKLYQYTYQDKIRHLKNENETEPELSEIEPELNEIEPELLDKEEVYKLLKKHNFKCLYCHIDLKEDNWSLDRKNCKKDHTLDNCVVSCVECNKSRSDQPFIKFYHESVLKRNNQPAIYIINEENKKVFELMKENIVGGPSIIFNRLHEVNGTKIQRVHYDLDKDSWYFDNFGNNVNKIIGFDANALYLWCIGQPQLCGKLKYIENNENNECNKLIESEYYNGTWDTLLNDVQNEKFFGCVEVDIKVPKSLYEYFSELPPIFVNKTYNSKMAGDVMDDIITNHLEKKHTTSRKLIATLKTKKILLKSSLLKWYLDHGLVVKKIYSIIPAKKERLYKNFEEWVSDSRRLGDLKPEHATKAENAKNIGNSAYGQSIMNKEKHTKVKIINEEEFNRIKSDFWTGGFEEYETTDGKRLFEVHIKKKNVNQNGPQQIGYGILQDAKLRMLQFYFDCLDKYIDRKDFQLIQMDTDSYYMALSGKFDDLIKPNMKEEFELDKNNWFPRTDEVNKAFDKRTPGLFKIEKEGIGMVALCSKSYYLLTEKDKTDKIACKGGQQKRNDDILNFENYKRALLDIELISGENAGLKYENKEMNVYKQKKILLNPIYVKGVVMEDGIHIHPLVL